MGCDIHGIFQRKIPTGWEDVEHNFDMNRDYQLFGVLAGVREHNVEPIAEPRGLPKDFLMADDDDDHPITDIKHARPEFYRKYILEDAANGPMLYNMGDHSQSWLTGEEMLAWFDNPPGAVQDGIIDRAVYETWDRVSTPSCYCSGLGGPSVVLVSEDDAVWPDDWTHIHVAWYAPMREELAYFFDEVKRLQDEHGQIRFVFGFDS